MIPSELILANPIYPHQMSKNIIKNSLENQEINKLRKVKNDLNQQAK